jgi:spermidine/putrescine transport system permease protein
VNRKKLIIMVPFVLWLGVFIVAPLVLVVYRSMTGAQGSVSLANYIRIGDPIYLSILLRSLWMAFLATLICLLICYPAALVLSSPSMRNNPIWLILLITPMWMNFLLRTYALLTLFENTGVINSFLQSIGLNRIVFLYNEYAVIFGIVFNMYPYMLFPIYTSVSKIHPSIIEAGKDLGANEWRCFLRIIFPLSISGVVSGITMVFVPSVTTFAISKLLGGGMVPLVGDVIEQQFRVAGDWNFGSALSTLVMVVVLICMWGVNRWSDSEGGAQLL